MFFELNESDHIALYAEDIQFTYSHLKKEVDRLKKAVKSRDMIICLCENSPASVTGYLASLNAGAVPLLLDRKIDRQLLDNLLSTYRPNYLYVPKDLEDNFAGYSRIEECMHYALLSRDKREEITLYSDLALLLTTSGSTGSPKLVRQTYRNIQSNAEAIAEFLKLTPDERPVTTLPMTFPYKSMTLP